MFTATARVAPEKTDFRPVLLSLPIAGVLPEKQMATKLSYTEQLKHSFWQKKRLEKLSEVDWTCERCEAKETTLHVHHKHYFKGRMAWEYELSDLQALCEVCHAKHHDVEELLKKVLATRFWTESTHVMALGIMAGFLTATYDLDDDVSRQVERLTPDYFYLGIIFQFVCTMEPVDVLAMLEKREVWQGGPVLDAVTRRMREKIENE